MNTEQKIAHTWCVEKAGETVVMLGRLRSQQQRDPLAAPERTAELAMLDLRWIAR
jgi:hypothetical protein